MQCPVYSLTRPRPTNPPPQFQMSAARPTLSLSRKTPLKSKKSGSASSGKKKTPASSSSSCNGAAAAAPTKPWVDTVNDLNVYKPSKEELEGKKAQRKSQNKVLAKVGPVRTVAA